ncbi:MAG TPA: hypothetical protein VHB70_18095 [Parafilimonas sp.]|nr:hypothetical protein [Parafilimonas sp.]
MKRILLLIQIILITFLLKAQTPTFEKINDTIYVDASTPREYAFKFSGTGNGDIAYAVKMSPDSEFPSDSVNATDNAGSFTFDSKKTEHIYHITIKNSKEENFNKQLIYLLLDDKNKTVSKCWLTIKNKKDEPIADVSNYRFIVGTNFDFADGIQAKNLYFNLQFFLPQAFNKANGFIGGIRENTLVSNLNDSINNIRLGSSGISYRLPSISYTGDSVLITQVDSPKINRSYTTKTLSIYFEPIFRLKNWSNNDDKSNTGMYFFGHLDLLRIVTDYNQSYSYVNARAVKIDTPGLRKYRAISDPLNNESVTYQYYYGGGFILYHNSPSVELCAKFMVGSAHLDTKLWVGYYGAEIGIREKTINAMIGAEYRGLMNQHNPNYLNIYLSKVFSLQKIFEVITK